MTTEDNKGKNHYVARVVLSAAEIVAYKTAGVYVSREMAVQSGRLSTAQFEDRDASTDIALMNSAALVSALPAVVLVVALGATWWKPLKNVASYARANLKSTVGAAAVLAASTSAVLQPPPANAYYATFNYAEWVNVGPNETAFLIPVEGQTSNQAQFMSETFLNDKKVAAKRIQIPHMTQPGSGTVSNYTVPSSILIKLDRSFVSRTFTKEGDRANSGGSKSTDSAFYFESKEGVPLNVGVAITAWIPEEKAALYLYRHGVKEALVATNASAEERTYASVFIARPLSEVMDINIHNAIQAELSQEFGQHAFDQAVEKKIELMGHVRDKIVKEFGDAGILITNMGFATQLGFPSELQTSINAVVIAENNAKAQASLRPVLDVYDKQANIKLKTEAAEAIKAGRYPQLPAFAFFGGDGAVNGWVNSLADLLGLGSSASRPAPTVPAPSAPVPVPGR